MIVKHEYESNLLFYVDLNKFRRTTQHNQFMHKFEMIVIIVTTMCHAQTLKDLITFVIEINLKISFKLNQSTTHYTTNKYLNSHTFNMLHSLLTNI